MIYDFKFYPYQRRFRQPLQTSHGIWEIRQGIILCLTDEMGKMGWGEIAPLSWFGSENLEQALAFCQQFGNCITKTQIKQIPESFPACQFGFESALEDIDEIQLETQTMGFALNQLGNDNLASNRQEAKQYVSNYPSNHQSSLPLFYSYLLPTGEPALGTCQKIIQQENIAQLPMTFKWKIGVNLIEKEIEIFYQLIKFFHQGIRLRLDANGGLNLEQAKTWLELADSMKIIEFIEQPLSPDQLNLMLDLSANYATPIALDESVATIEQLEACHHQGWRGIYVIKPAIAGSPKRLRQFFAQHSIDAVFSSVFETQIGRKAILKLAMELSKGDRAVGFGVDDWFENPFELDKRDYLDQGQKL